MKVIEVYDDFRNWLTSESLSEGTVELYLARFRSLEQYCRFHSIHVEYIGNNVARDYMAWLHERPNQRTGGKLASATIAKHYDRLKRFSRYLNEKGHITDELTEGIRRPIPRYKVIDGFSNEQLQALLDGVLKVRSSWVSQERTILLLFLISGTGMRINEVLPLKPLNFIFSQRIIKVVGKGNKEREIPFSPEIGEVIQEWIRSQNIGYDDYLFKSRTGKPLSAAGFRDTMRRVKKHLGGKFDIESMRVSPHTLRHTFAKHWVVNNGNTIALSKILGHNSTQQTNKYVRLWGVDIVGAYDRCSPNSGIKLPGKKPKRS